MSCKISRALFTLLYLFSTFHQTVNGEQTEQKVENELIYNPNNFGVAPDLQLKLSDIEQNVNDIGALKRVLKDGFLDRMLKSKKLTTPVNGFSVNENKNFNVSVMCLNDTEQLLLDIINETSYAKRMLDADFKLPSGVEDGNLQWLGSYEECISDLTRMTFRRYSTKYCMVYIPVKTQVIPLALVLGTCLPSTCNKDDAKGLADTVLSSIGIESAFAICVEDKPFTPGAVAALTVCMVIILLVATGTIADVFFIYFDEYTKKREECRARDAQINHSDTCTERTGLLSGTSVISYGDNTPAAPLTEVPKVNKCRILMAFSIITNTRKLMNTSTAKSPLASLNGLRVLSMWWVILGHTYAFVLYFLDNPSTAYNIIKRFTFMAVLNGTYSVDTFFYMSGVLVVFNCLNMMRDNNGKMKWAMFYFHRFWRLTPVYAFTIMMFATLVRYMGKGPYMSSYYDGNIGFTEIVDECSRTWWANLLYINNFYPNYGNINKQCIGWSWYLANDMQFYIFSPIIMILLYKRRIIGISVAGFLILSCVAIRAAIVYEYGIYIPTGRPTSHTGDVYAQNDLTYNKPYTRMSTYLVGMLVGYFLHNCNCRLRMHKIVVVIGWCAAIATGLAVIYGLFDYYHNSKQATLGLSVFYSSCSRCVWGIALAWVTVACATGYGGPVNHILSWKIWAPLGRLTYCAYLIHPIILFLYSLNRSTPVHFTDATMIYMYIAGLVVSYCCAYLMSMAVEAPMLGLEKMIFKRN